MYNKYDFKEYNSEFPEIYEKEREILEKKLFNNCKIKHVGSTAIKNLGGKDIIDIAIQCDRKDKEKILIILKKLSYEFHPKEENRLFFQKYVPDKQKPEKVFHIHLTFFGNDEFDNLIKFKDYLINNPEEVEKYSEIKKQVSKSAQGDKEKYQEYKDSFIKEILKK